MAQYFYTRSSLPELTLGEVPFFGYETFIEACERFVSANDMHIIRAATIAPDRTLLDSEGPLPAGVLGAWIGALRRIARTVALVRRSRLGWDADVPPADPDDASLIEAARAAMNEPSPLEAERSMTRIKWALLDGMAARHFFDIDALVLYALKLQLAHRYLTIGDAEAGRTEFDRQYRVVVENETEN